MKVLFVCTGNTCRSPMAEAIMRKKAEEANLDIEVRSRGVAAYNGSPASSHAVTLLKEKGITVSHQSGQVTKEDVDWADYIFAMTTSHKLMLMSAFPGAADKTFTLKEYSYPENDNVYAHDIQDPYGGSLGIYKESAEEIELAIDAIINQWKNNHNTV